VTSEQWSLTENWLMKHKVLAYITREQSGRRRLLVFTHRDHPEAGVQVPAGTVEPGETVEAALFREVREEAGLADLRLARKLAEQEDIAWGQIRHVFHLIAPGDAPDSWLHLVNGHGEDSGMAFEYYWADLSTDLYLAGDQGRWLSLLRL
jgi:8-oxo-dGTP pyrophosphatase MutT (NUDIX family)